MTGSHSQIFGCLCGAAAPRLKSFHHLKSEKMKIENHEIGKGTSAEDIVWLIDQYSFRNGRTVLFFEMWDHDGKVLEPQDIKEKGITVIGSFSVGYLD